MVDLVYVRAYTCGAVVEEKKHYGSSENEMMESCEKDGECVRSFVLIMLEVSFLACWVLASLSILLRPVVPFVGGLGCFVAHA